MTDERNSDVTPESLMENFKGPKLVSLVVLTIVVHVVVIFGSSVPHLIKKFSRDDAKLTKDDHIKMAVEEATIEIRKIAEDHGLNPQEISDQFSSGGSRTKKASDDADVVETKKPAEDTAGTPSEEPERPKSAIEKKLETKVEGPKIPTFDDKKDDIF